MTSMSAPLHVACFVNPDYGSGIGRHVREMVTGLARRPGITVEILTNVVSLRRNPELAKQFDTLTIAPLPWSSVTIERLWKTIRWPKLDSYLSTNCQIVYSPAQTRLPVRAVPTIITIHDVQAFERSLPWSDTHEHRLFRRKWQSWLPKAAREATRILTVSEFSKMRIAELVGIPPSKIGVVGNGVSDVFFRDSQSPPVARQPSVVVVGGLRTKKGAADTLAVARALVDRRSPLHIDVVGDNESQWVEASRSFPNVRLQGVISDAALAAMLASSTALLFLSPYEGFGIPAVEAMAAGTPAVVANAASLPEVVGDAGLVVNAADAESVAALLQRLHDDSLWRESIVERGAAHAARYSWDACVERLLKELRNAIASPSPGDSEFA